MNNVKRLYWVTALSNTWFIAANWLYFYRRYMNDGQLGILDATTFLIGFLAEVPSGALADKIGRKPVLTLGLLFGVIGMFLHAAGGYEVIFVAQLFISIGWALVSGADDALVYDSLKTENKEHLWDKVVARKYQILVAVSIVSYVVGAVLYNLWFRLAFISQGFFALVALLVALGFKERGFVNGNTSYVSQITLGFRSLTERKIIPYTIIALVILGTGYAFDFGVLRPFVLDKAGIFATGQAIVIALSGLVSIIMLSKLERLKTIRGEKIGLLVLSTTMLFGVVINIFQVGVIIGTLSFILIKTSTDLLLPWLNDVVQRSVPSSRRATSLSTLALFQKLPYVFMAAAAGAYSAKGELPIFLVMLAVFMSLGLIVYVLTNKKLV